MGTGDIEGPLQPALPVETTSLTQSASDKETMLHSPELAAFEALLEAPDEKFAGAAFSPLESAALGLLAGLRGAEAALPFIQMRRQDARFAFDAARRAKTEQLGGLFNMAQIAETNRRFEATQEQQIRVVKLQQSGALERAELAARGRLQLRPIPPNTALDLGSAIEAASDARGFVRRFMEAGQPGVFPLNAVLPPFTEAQQEVAADLQATTGPIKTKLIGSARSAAELADIANFLPNFGDRDSTIRIGMTTVATKTIAAVRTQIQALRMTGHDTQGLEQILRERGFSGPEVIAPPTPTPPGLTVDTSMVLADELEGAF